MTGASGAAKTLVRNGDIQLCRMLPRGCRSVVLPGVAREVHRTLRTRVMDAVLGRVVRRVGDNEDPMQVSRCCPFVSATRGLRRPTDNSAFDV